MLKAASEPLNQIVLALFSVLLGLIFWAIVKQLQTVDRPLSLPVRTLNLPPFIEVQSIEPSAIAATFTFRAGDEAMIQTGDLRVEIDLSVLERLIATTEEFVAYPIDVTRAMVRAPERLTLTGFAQSNPRVTIRARPRLATARIVANVAEGELPAPGFRLELDKIVVEPPTTRVAVTAEGLERANRNELTIATQRIPVAGRRSSVTGIFGLQFDASLGLYPQPGRPLPTVDVLVPIEEIEETREFANVPVRYEPLRVGVRAILTPSQATVTLRGPVSALEGLTEDSFRLIPRPTTFLDEERPGDTIETALEVSFAADLERQSAALSSVRVTPNRVLIRFVATDPEGPPPPPRPEPTATPGPTAPGDSDASAFEWQRLENLLRGFPVAPAATPVSTPLPESSGS
jgi:hypothetical protein